MPTRTWMPLWAGTAMAAIAGVITGILWERGQPTQDPVPPPTPVDVPAPEVSERAVVLLRERIYGAISCLAALTLVTRASAEHDAWDRLISMLVVAGGLFAASLLAEAVAQLAVNQRRMRGPAGAEMLRSSGQILVAAVLPAVPLVLSGLGWVDVDPATWVAVGLLVAELALFALIAVRRLKLGWWQQSIATASLVAVGAVVVAMKVVAH